TAIMSALGIMLLLSLLLSVGFGAADLTVGRTVHILLDALTGGADGADMQDRIILLELRLPRILLGALVGAGLAMVGTVLQGITRNPLADPYLFGISSGASVGAVAVMLYGGALFGAIGLPIAAFFGAMLSLSLVFVLARESGGFTTQRLILTGVGVQFVLMAVTNMLILGGPDRGAESVLFWMLGGFSAARWSLVLSTGAAVLIGFVWLLLRAPSLDAMALGDEGAHTLGVPVRQVTAEMFVVTALVTGTLVAASGSVGFVGLVVPHCARWLAGARIRAMLIPALLLGAILTVWTDVAARAILAPRELPIGVMTAAIGGIFFIVILKRRRTV
ncbi:MAG: FecCD family ABC transporter permease, partial [Sphingobium sp.]